MNLSSVRKVSKYMLKVEIDNETRNKVEEIASDINKYVNSGKWELFNDDAKELTSKHPVNDLLMVGVKYIRLLNNRFYLELPYRALEEEDVEKILFNIATITKGS